MWARNRGCYRASRFMFSGRYKYGTMLGLKSSGQIRGEGGFPHAAFLVEDGDNHRGMVPLHNNTIAHMTPARKPNKRHLSAGNARYN